MPAEQSYSNHTRWYPLQHFVVAPLLFFFLIYQSVRLYQEPSVDRAVMVIFAITAILLSMAARLQTLTVQNRLVRLEERLRYREVLTPELADRAAKLRLGYIIALRFASDDELPALVEKTLNGEFDRPKDIKIAIRNWRGDLLRA
jgi:hypothetical protein